MSITTRQNILKLFTWAVAFFAFFQLMIPGMPIKDPVVIKYMSGIVIFLTVSLTAWKQYLSTEIRNNSIWATMAIALLATIGGFNDLLNIFPIPEMANQWIRFGLTFITAFINFVSQQLFPTNPDNYPVKYMNSK